MSKKRNLKKKKKKFIWVYASALLLVGSFIYVLPKLFELADVVGTSFLDIIGSRIKDINIEGASDRTINIVRNNVGVSEGDSIFKLSSKNIYENVMEVSWVKSAIVKKILPNVLTINLIEAIPIAVFQHDGVFTLIDNDGIFIEEVTAKPADLPIVSGDNANKNIKHILPLLMRTNFINDRIETLMFVRERRWDIVVAGIKIRLPEKGIEEAIAVLSEILSNDNISGNTAREIDLRVPGNVVVRGLKIKSAKTVV